MELSVLFCRTAFLLLPVCSPFLWKFSNIRSHIRGCISQSNVAVSTLFLMKFVRFSAPCLPFTRHTYGFYVRKYSERQYLLPGKNIPFHNEDITFSIPHTVQISHWLEVWLMPLANSLQIFILFHRFPISITVLYISYVCEILMRSLPSLYWTALKIIIK